MIFLKGNGISLFNRFIFCLSSKQNNTLNLPISQIMSSQLKRSHLEEIHIPSLSKPIIEVQKEIQKQYLDDQTNLQKSRISKTQTSDRPNKLNEKSQVQVQKTSVKNNFFKSRLSNIQKLSKVKNIEQGKNFSIKPFSKLEIDTKKEEFFPQKKYLVDQSDILTNLKRFIQEKQSLKLVDQKKEQFLYIVYEFALKLQSQNKKELKINKKSFKLLMKNEILDQIIVSLQNKQILYIQQSSQDTNLIFYLSVNKFIETRKPSTNIILKKQIQGNELERIFCNGILKVGSQIIIATKGQDKKFKKQKYKLDAKAKFRPLNKTILGNEDRSIYKNFQQILTKALENQNQYIYGLPYYDTKKQNDKNSPISRCFDFIIVQYNKQRNIYFINTFDLTVTSNKLKEKIKEFKNLMNQISMEPVTTKYQDSSFEITHNIICFKQLCRIPENLKEIIKSQPNITDIKIVTSSLEKLTVSKCKDILKRNQFQEWKKWVIPSKKQKMQRNE